MFGTGKMLINNITGEIYIVHRVVEDLYLIEYRGQKHFVRVDNIVWSVWRGTNACR